MMDKYFNCHECGKCCNSGPSLSVAEALLYQEVFVVGLRYQVEMIHKGNNARLNSVPLSISQDMTAAKKTLWVDRYSSWQGNIYPKISTEFSDYYLNIYPVDVGYSCEPNNSCLALSNNGKCSLHPNKPSMCRSIPFDPCLPESHQSFKLELFKQYECVSDHGDKENLIYSSEKIKSEKLREGFDSKLESIKLDSKTMSALMALIESGSAYFPGVDDILKIGREGGHYETSILPFFLLLKSMKLLKSEHILSFIECQSVIIESEIRKAIVRKVKSEMQRTKQLRSILATYKFYQSEFIPLK